MLSMQIRHKRLIASTAMSQQDIFGLDFTYMSQIIASVIETGKLLQDLVMFTVVYKPPFQNNILWN